MLDQRLWKTHIHQREQQFMQEAERDRLADGYRRAQGAANPLWAALREAATVFRARIMAAARTGTEPANTRPPVAGGQTASILAEAEDIVRLHWGTMSNIPSDCTCDTC